MSKNDQLSIPDAALKDLDSVEILRVWVANKASHVTIAVGAWEDPAAWGILLADLARHIANAFALDGGDDVQESLRRIVMGLEAELSSPTDEPFGHLE